MQNIMKKTAAGAVMGGALLFTGGWALAQAAPPVQLQDGLVNLALGDVTAAQRRTSTSPARWRALVCPSVDVGSVNVLARPSTSRWQPQNVVCTTSDGQRHHLRQNGPDHWQTDARNSVHAECARPEPAN